MKGDAYAVVKRAMDIVISLSCGLLLVAPFVLLAAAIRMDSPGPAFFRQDRPGRFGRPFRVWKLRTMTHRPERTGVEQPPQASDPRVTRIGRFLRTYGLDELPQLINVLRGEMSLVGPRPTLIERAARYDAHQRRRLAVKPGITGPAIIAGRNDLSWDEKIERDLWYVDHASLIVDLRILLATPWCLVRGKGVYMRPEDGFCDDEGASR